MILRARTTENGHRNGVWLWAMRASWSSWLQACANCLVILKLFLHTDFHAKNETGKFISVIRMVRFTRLLICHTIKLKPSPSEFTAPCELLFSSVFIVIKTKAKTTNNVSSRLCKSCILKWLDNWVFYLTSCNKPTVSQKRIKRQGFFFRCLIFLMFLFISEESKVEGSWKPKDNINNSC